MKRWGNSSLAVLAFVSMLISGQNAVAQRLIGVVTVNVERLPQENRNKLQGLERILEAYINQTDWGTPDEYGYDVYLDLNIYFEEAIPVSFEDRYKARVTVSNRSDCVQQDPRWEFAYAPGSQIQYSSQFDPFRSMIDYYVFAVFGYEFDKVRKFGGLQYFETARQITQAAALSSRYYIGWDDREEWIEDYIDVRNDQFRYLKFLYYTGEWLYYDERDRETARQYLLYALNPLERVEEAKRRRFFELNYYNYSNALEEYGEFNAINRLASLDPGHSEFYQRILNNR